MTTKGVDVFWTNTMDPMCIEAIEEFEACPPSPLTSGFGRDDGRSRGDDRDRDGHDRGAPALGGGRTRDGDHAHFGGDPFHDAPNRRWRRPARLRWWPNRASSGCDRDGGHCRGDVRHCGALALALALGGDHNHGGGRDRGSVHAPDARGGLYHIDRWQRPREQQRPQGRQRPRPW
jgi:hypothetical protein